MPVDADLAEAIDACRETWRPDEDPSTGRFDALLDRWPDDPAAQYAVGIAHDEAGSPVVAIGLFERALGGLTGTELRRCFLRLGSALESVGRSAEAVDVLERGLAEFPGSRSLRTFLALALHETGRSDAALGLLLAVLVDPMASPDLELFAPEIRLRAAALVGRDG